MRDVLFFAVMLCLHVCLAIACVRCDCMIIAGLNAAAAVFYAACIVGEFLDD